jgi:hypothetical protein
MDDALKHRHVEKIGRQIRGCFIQEKLPNSSAVFMSHLKHLVSGIYFIYYLRKMYVSETTFISQQLVNSLLFTSTS